MSHSRLNFILLPSLLALALPGWAETRPANAKAVQAQPLNLSLPRDELLAPGHPEVDEKIERNLRAPVPVPGSNAPSRPAILPYGAGYEYRHQEMGGAGPGAGPGPGAGASPGAGPGAGRRGR